MENGNKSNETNAHDENNIGGYLESRSIIRVKLQHCSSCTSRCTRTCCSSPAHAGSSCRTSSLGTST
uniref:Uncharacterized protein n=1 Tax=Cucumis melo TaxID=3656 RepID=A0A9I9EBW3_CUCME